MNFWNIAMFESSFVLTLVFALGFVKMPKILLRRKLIRGYPWGYYEGCTPKEGGEFFAEDNTNFLYNTGARFEGVPGLGILGEYAAHGFCEGMGNW